MREPIWLKLKRVALDQRGYTLIELVASSLIFLTVLIPLISVYVDAVDTYQETSLKNQVRNETDFILGEVMRTIQEASYFELAPPDEEAATLLEIVTHADAGIRDTPVHPVSRGLMLYKRSIAYEAGSTRSLLTRETRFFTPCPAAPCGYRPFPVNHQGYIVDGLFEMTDERRVILYLVVALRHQPDDHLQTVLQWLNDPHEENRNYVRIVRTEIDVSSMREGG